MKPTKPYLISRGKAAKSLNMSLPGTIYLLKKHKLTVERFNTINYLFMDEFNCLVRYLKIVKQLKKKLNSLPINKNSLTKMDELIRKLEKLLEEL